MSARRIDRWMCRTAHAPCALVATIAACVIGACSSPPPANPIAAPPPTPPVVVPVPEAPRLEQPTPIDAVTVDPAPPASAFAPRFDPPLPVPPKTEPRVRVRVGAGLRAPQSFSCPSGRFTMTSGDDRWTASAPIRVALGANGWTVTGAGQAHLFPIGPLTIQPVGKASIDWDGTQWPGVVALTPVAGRAFDLVMDVGVEEYLPGVLAKELYPQWDEDTFRAQTVAARSWVLVEEARWEGRRHFDVSSGESSQAWAGHTRNTRAREAVDATRGVVLTWKGRVVPAFYSSSCGGRGANAIGSVTANPNHDIAPVRSGDQPARTGCCESKAFSGTAHYRWSATVSAASVQAAVRAYGTKHGYPTWAGITRPTAIEVAATCANGRPSEFRLRFKDRNPVTIPAPKLREAINGGIAGEGGTRTLKSDDFAVSASSKGFVFAGRGFGHGVGMCQHGAQAAAASGASWTSILERYYPGAQCTRAW